MVYKVRVQRDPLHPLHPLNPLHLLNPLNLFYLFHSQHSSTNGYLSSLPCYIPKNVIRFFHLQRWPLFRSVLLCLAAGLATPVWGQTLWQENFSGYPDGTQQAPDGSWTTSFNDCDDPGPYNQNGAYWGVLNGRFRVNDIEGFSCNGNRGNNGNSFLTEVIDISGAGCVDLSVSVANGGGLECGFAAGPNFTTSGPFSGHDQVYVEYQLNGGPWTAFPGGYFCGNANGTTTANDLSGNTVRIRIRAGTQANDEEYFLDNIRVTGSTDTYTIPDLGSYCSNQGNQNLPTTIDGITGDWNGSGVSLNRFNPSLVGTGTYTLTFTPDAGSCAVAQSTDVEVRAATSFSAVADQTSCDAYTLPAIQGSNVPPTAAYFTGPNGSGTRYEAGDNITASRQLYVYGGTGGCTDQETFQVTIVEGPSIDNPGPQESCASFTFPNITGSNLNDPRYYTQPGGTGQVYDTGDRYTQSGSSTFYIFDQEGACTDQATFQVTITPPPNMDPLPSQTVCNEVILPAITGANLQDPAYYSQPDGNGTRYEIGDTVRPSTDFRRFYVYDGTAGCSDSETFDVTFNRLEAAIELFRPITCFGANDGQLAVRITEGTGPFRYNWSSPDNPANDPLNGVAAGTYFLTILYARVCVYSDSIRVPQPDSLTLNCSESKDLSAPLANDGRITGTFSGGTGPYWVYLTGPVIDSLSFTTADSFAFTDLPKGDYQVLIVDDRGCSADCFSFIDGPDCNVFASPQIRLPTCFDSEDGRIGLVTSGGTAPYTYDWSENRFDGRSFAENLPNGTYSVQVTGARGCTFDTTMVLPVIDPLTALCSNQTDTAILDIQGGRAPYMAILAGPQPDTFTIASPGILEIPSLPTGEYTLLLTDASGCQQDCAFFIPDPACELMVTPEVVDESCTVASDGQITLNIRGAAGQPTINWLDGSTDSVRTDLFPGSYSYTVEDTLGCRQIATVRVSTQNIAPFFSIMVDNEPICANGCDSLQIAALGRPPFSFSLDIEATDTTLTYPFTLMDSTSTVSFCLPGMGIADSLVTYRVTDFRDSVCPAGLEESLERSLVPLDTQLTQPIICPSDSISIAGDLFDLDNPAGFVLRPGQGGACDSILAVDVQFHTIDTAAFRPTICPTDSLILAEIRFDISSPSGFVRLPDQDSRGCDSLIRVDLQFSQEEVDTLRPVVCPNDTFSINNSVYFFGKSQGLEVIQVADPMVCDSIVYVDLQFEKVDTTVIDTSLCKFDSVIVNNTLYDLFNPTGTEFIPSDIPGECDRIVQIDLKYPSFITKPIQPVVCVDDTFRLGDESFIYRIKQGGGVYIEYDDPGACDTLYLVNLDVLPDADTLFQPTICPEDTFTLEGESFDFVRSQDTVILPNASARGCDSLLYVDLNFYATDTAFFTDTRCISDPLTIGDATFDQQNPSGIARLFNADRNGCDSLIQVDLTFFDTVEIAVTDPQPVCAGASTSFSISTSEPNVSLTWEEDWSGLGTTFVQVGQEASYSFAPDPGDTLRLVAVLDPVTGCRQNRDLVIPTFVSQPAVSLRRDTSYNGQDLSCSNAVDGQLLAGISGTPFAVTYSWSGGLPATARQLNLPSGRYQVTITDEIGCTDSASISLTEPPPLSLQINTLAPTCAEQNNGSLEFTGIIGGVPPYSYRLNNDDIFQPIPDQRNNLATGNYTLLVRDQNNCTIRDSVQIPQAPPLIVDLPVEITLNLGDSVLLDPVFSFTPTRIQWSSRPEINIPPVPTPVVSPFQTTEVTVEAGDSIGCSITATVRLLVDRQLRVYAPTAFRPGTDGPNGQFRLFSGNQVERVLFLRVFDRWGQLLFEAENLPPDAEQAGWDGRVNGQPMPTGVYVFIAQVELADGRVESISGDITLLR